MISFHKNMLFYHKNIYQISVQPFSSENSVSLTSNGRAAVYGQVTHEELRVVGNTLFHCDIAQQVVIAR